MTYYTILSSAIGDLLLTGTTKGLSTVRLPSLDGSAHTPNPAWQYSPEHFTAATTQLTEYFAGTRQTFAVPLAWQQGTDFQQKVWHELINIPYGTTTTYGDIARRINHAQAARAVGMANNQNRLPIIVPCHRVVGATGKLVGYAGGLRLKQQLLRIEGIAA